MIVLRGEALQNDLKNNLFSGNLFLRRRNRDISVVDSDNTNYGNLVQLDFLSRRISISFNNLSYTAHRRFKIAWLSWLSTSFETTITNNSLNSSPLLLQSGLSESGYQYRYDGVDYKVNQTSKRNIQTYLETTVDGHPFRARIHHRKPTYMSLDCHVEHFNHIHYFVMLYIFNAEIDADYYLYD